GGAPACGSQPGRAPARRARARGGEPAQAPPRRRADRQPRRRGGAEGGRSFARSGRALRRDARGRHARRAREAAFREAARARVNVATLAASYPRARPLQTALSLILLAPGVGPIAMLPVLVHPLAERTG